MFIFNKESFSTSDLRNEQKTNGEFHNRQLTTCENIFVIDESHETPSIGMITLWRR